MTTGFHANGTYVEPSQPISAAIGDFTGDGWPDVLCSNLGTPVFLYGNPKGEARHWDKFQVLPALGCEVALRTLEFG